MSENKSNYEKLIERLTKEGKISTMSGEEMLEFGEEMNKGMYEWSLENKRQQAKADNEVKNLHLD